VGFFAGNLVRVRDHASPRWSYPGVEGDIGGPYRMSGGVDGVVVDLDGIGHVVFQEDELVAVTDAAVIRLHPRT
jgi:hypothetical protein